MNIFQAMILADALHVLDNMPKVRLGRSGGPYARKSGTGTDRHHKRKERAFASKQRSKQLARKRRKLTR